VLALFSTQRIKLNKQVINLSVLAANGLHKSYGKRNILQGISLQVNSAEVVGLLGPNGAGKTTCFYMIVGLVGIDRGTITLDDADLTQKSMHQRARHGVGYLAQEASVFRKLSVQDNIMAILQTRKGMSRRDRHEKMESLLEEFQITHIRDSLGISLSGGERRRVEIARALATEPAFILLDEPFAGVDPISVIEIQKIVSHLKQRGIGVLITDHNVRETLGICDRAYILGNGTILTQGTPQDVLANRQAREIYLGEDFKL
jgi:lipopolysaccharide export system ATP-binding protein